MTPKIFFIRAYYKIIGPWRKLYWYIARPETRGVKCMILFDGKVLLQKLSYAHKKWTMPGGGVKRNETWEDAAKREVLEEVGIRLNSLTFIGSYLSEKEYKRDTIQCFLGYAPGSEYTIDPQEVTEAAWFPLDMLPEPHAQSVEKVLAMYRAYLQK